MDRKAATARFRSATPFFVLDPGVLGLPAGGQAHEETARPSGPDGLRQSEGFQDRQGLAEALEFDQRPERS